MFLDKIRLENILSFKDAELELRPLNVLIGANASGKSNLVRVFGLLRALPKDMQREISEGGGPRAWINRRTVGPACVTLYALEGIGPSYRLVFQASAHSYEILEEYAPLIFRRESDRFKFEAADEPMHTVPSALQSVIAQWRIPGQLIGELASRLESIRLYREFKTGPGTQARQGISASASDESLSEDGANLAPVLGKLLLHGKADAVNGHLQEFFEYFLEVRVHAPGGVSQVYIVEKAVSTAFSAISLSDGTLRLLCLLAVLLDPDPGPLVCIEEPEVGMHPDAIRLIANLLAEASARTQLVVTTHSPALVDALTDQPESVVVCERDPDGTTQFRRLKSSELDEWLERYSLGQLWQKGEIGGNRW